ALTPGPLLRLKTGDSRADTLVWERWNDHSQVRVYRLSAGGKELIIDRTAASRLQPVTATSDIASARVESFVGGGSRLAYRLGARPLEQVGIIGVGGGPDILEALQAGAARVDGFELNGRIIELLRGSGGHTVLGLHPAVRLVHDEARHALEHRDARYDVLRMSLTDTWAATLQGGFVLSEASLYTEEAWTGFLRHLTPTGRLVVTRWLLPGAPSEAERTIALAAAALRATALDPAQHLLVLEQRTAAVQEHDLLLLTVMVSATPYSAAEVDDAERTCAREGCRVLLAPHRLPAGPLEAEWARHFTVEGHAERTRASRYDVSVPRDTRPFFFLQVRPWDIPLLLEHDEGSMVDHIVRGGVRGMVLGCALSLVLALLLAVAAMRLAPGAASPASRGHAWPMAAIGVGYMLLQLGLHQRLSIAVGHPTMTLAVVTAASILGTGIGSALFGRDTVGRG
ncbi:MAG TPA: class I SAM-dependent methyltransferase, partial [Gemmatimonadales bacterium]|nr:class I SAM-dependent methyltransferase [Gemmatimonadales bacterium]